MPRIAILIVILALASCSLPKSRSAPEYSNLPNFPVEEYLKAERGSVYQIDENLSFADILVRRGGTLARFGHDHVVSARSIYGYLMIAGKNPKGSRADLRIQLASLIVDDPLTRKKFRLDTEPSQSDILHTSENMQSKVLESDKWQQTHLHIVVTGGTPDALEASLTLALHGREETLPIVIHTDGLTAEKVRISGSFSFKQSSFGIEPFSVLGGGLRVEDTVEVSYSLVADRLLPAAE
jgi:hypothetical protein